MAPKPSRYEKMPSPRLSEFVARSYASQRHPSGFRHQRRQPRQHGHARFSCERLAQTRQHQEAPATSVHPPLAALDTELQPREGAYAAGTALGLHADEYP
ncbi:hypothetical protein VTI74DRAFT_7143 [Chaetomium olivicolor]